MFGQPHEGLIHPRMVLVAWGESPRSSGGETVPFRNILAFGNMEACARFQLRLSRSFRWISGSGASSLPRRDGFIGCTCRATRLDLTNQLASISFVEIFILGTSSLEPDRVLFPTPNIVDQPCPPSPVPAGSVTSKVFLHHGTSSGQALRALPAIRV